MYTKEDLNRINITVNIRKLLVKLGADDCNIKQLYSKPDYRCNCWWRGGDNPHGFGTTFNPNKKRWLCTDFTQRSFGNIDLFEFVGKLTNLQFYNAVQLVESCCEGSTKDLNIEDLQNGYQTKTISYLEPHVLDCYEYGLHPYLHQRGYLPQTAKDFKLGFCTWGELIDRVTIPIFDEQNKLVAVQGRTTVEDTPKYKFIEGTGDSAKQVLYNYANAIEYAKRKGWLLVVEGCPSVWRLHQYGLKNVVATMSTSVTDTQIKKLIQTGLKIVIFFDADENNAGIYGTNKFARRLKELNATNVFMTNLIYQKVYGSPDDATKEQIAVAIKNIKKLF